MMTESAVTDPKSSGHSSAEGNGSKRPIGRIVSLILLLALIGGASYSYIKSDRASSAQSETGPPAAEQGSNPALIMTPDSVDPLVTPSPEVTRGNGSGPEDGIDPEDSLTARPPVDSESKNEEDGLIEAVRIDDGEESPPIDPEEFYDVMGPPFYGDFYYVERSKYEAGPSEQEELLRSYFENIAKGSVPDLGRSYVLRGLVSEADPITGGYPLRSLDIGGIKISPDALKALEDSGYRIILTPPVDPGEIDPNAVIDGGAYLKKVRDGDTIYRISSIGSIILGASKKEQERIVSYYESRGNGPYLVDLLIKEGATGVITPDSYTVIIISPKEGDILQFLKRNLSDEEVIWYVSLAAFIGSSDFSK
ncbi:MAG: hypothetical protein Kow002_09070 [Anaerolineales bacterium]